MGRFPNRSTGGQSQSSGQGRQGQGQSQQGQSKTDFKFYAHGMGKQGQTLTYSQVKDYIVQFVQKTFENGDNIEVSLRKEELLDISGDEPVRSISQEDDADERKFEQDGFNIKYKAELE